jgi:hypothetical protein
MVPEQADLTLIEGNPETVKETVTDDDTALPLNLTGKVVTFIIKADRTVPDTDPSVVTLSTATGEITITDAVNGVCQVAVPAQPAGVFWRRLDVVTAGQPKTAIYGHLYVINV